MNTLALVPAAQFDHATLATTFNEGYGGYEFPVHLDAATFGSMVKSVDIDLARSVVALEGARPAAFAMLALRGLNAWICGMGVTHDFRGRGLGAEVMRAVIANARAAGASTIELEVLVGNAHAIGIYEALGFVPVRRLVVWLIEPAARPAATRATHGPVLVPLDYFAALQVIGQCVVDPAPWQRAPESITNVPERPVALGSIEHGTVTGAVVYRASPQRLSILALGARGPEQRLILDTLVEGVLSQHPKVPLRLLNLPEGDPAEPVFERLGARAEARQIHMRLTL